MIDSAECWGIINLQKSRYSLPEQQKFTINLAIAAKRILRFYGEPADRAPRHFTCHWQIRIGQLIPGTLDHWWVFSDEKSYAPAAAEVMQLVTTKAVGLIQEHLSERGLLQLWDTYLGFEYPTLKYKSILLAERGEFEKLPWSSSGSVRFVEAVWLNQERNSTSLA